MARAETADVHPRADKTALREVSMCAVVTGSFIVVLAIRQVLEQRGNALALPELGRHIESDREAHAVFHGNP